MFAISPTQRVSAKVALTREEISGWRYMSFEEQKRVIKKLHERGETNSVRAMRRPRSAKRFKN